MEGVQEARKQVCKFYNEGKCRFGSDCHNLHEGHVANVAKKGEAKVEEKQKEEKRPMKTAFDVIKRIQWDEMMPAECFTVGYLDRFKGIVEDPFTKFSNWGDLASADYEALAIPQHRIEYFKYKDTKVWDKKARLDLVFGSSGINDGKDIEAVMYEVDDRLKDLMLNRNDEQSDKDTDNDDEDEDDDDGVQVDISPIAQSFPIEERSTHFLAVRITEPAIIETARRVQLDAVKQEEALNDCLMGTGLFHVTLGMLRLTDGIDGTNEAIAAVQQIQPQLQELVATGLRFRVDGLDTFGQRVLYAKVHPEPEETFWQFASLVNDAIAKTSDRVSVTNKFELMPHMTLIKVNRPVAKIRNSKYLPSALYEAHIKRYFGCQHVDNLQLCVLEATTRFDGFYRTLCEIKFDQ